MVVAQELAYFSAEGLNVALSREDSWPWHLENFSRPIAMGADVFMDGRTFDPEPVVEYLSSLDIQTLTPAVQTLSLVNV